ncbi:WD repeat-containing protein 20 isoform X9 [Lynx rufus]|uniref:WD repeat-containing protein 20 isoform X9 n=1 Tax=Lynx rufus TaxID=61384 RepID=UPI001F124CB8|nr:WD repeat-containing protein 20 isoform X9 [Lynx rufus]
MATEGGGKEMNEIKTQFTTREGLYKLLPHSEYSRPNRVPFNSQGSNPVRVSFVNLNDQSGNGDRLCFNVGRELYFYIYKGVRKAADLSKPIDKRIYKGTQPTCHDFNHLTATAESVSLLVGFSAGQVQLIDPIKKETSKLFNEEVWVRPRGVHTSAVGENTAAVAWSSRLVVGPRVTDGSIFGGSVSVFTEPKSCSFSVALL